MNYSKEEVIQYTQEEDVKFIRLAFCDVFGHQKNISVIPDELKKAFAHGIAIDASAIEGFGDGSHAELLLHPEPETLMPLPWRPEHGRVVQMFSTITYPDGTPFECDTRTLLKNAVAYAKDAGYEFSFSAEQEFYLFLLDQDGNRTTKPCDDAGYMDIAPNDRGENVRREICLTLEKMGIRPESSHHEVGPGQNEISLHPCDSLRAADNIQSFRRVAKLVADRNGLHADFSQKPLKDEPSSGICITISAAPTDKETFSKMVSGIVSAAESAFVFFKPKDSTKVKAPADLVTIPAAPGKAPCAKFRFPYPGANPYLAFALMIYAAIDGANGKTDGDFLKNHVPGKILAVYNK